MADETSSLINLPRMETYDEALKNYINNNAQAKALLENVSLLIAEEVTNGKALIAKAITNKGVSITKNATFTELADAIKQI